MSLQQKDSFEEPENKDIEFFMQSNQKYESVISTLELKVHYFQFKKLNYTIKLNPQF